MKRICVVPHWSSLRGNQIFALDQTYANNLAYSVWRRLAADQGFALDTDDVCPPQDADGIWLIDLPRKRSDFDQLLRTKKRETKVVLQVCESPLIVPQSHEKRNQVQCDFVMTYEKPKIEDPRRFHYEIPNYLDMENTGIPFAERRGVVMINSNKQEGWLGSGAVGSNRFPGVGKYFNGWCASFTHKIHPARGELYSWRRRFGRAAEQLEKRELDIYGIGWTGESISWMPGRRPQPFRCASGELLVNREETLNYHQKIPLIGRYRFGVAVENFRGDAGYVSEKLFDVMRAGAVPIYLGEESIHTILPEGSFVDVRAFRSHEELLRYLVNCPEDEWEKMRAKGQSFLMSERSAVFGMQAFAETAMKVLRNL